METNFNTENDSLKFEANYLGTLRVIAREEDFEVFQRYLNEENRKEKPFVRYFPIRTQTNILTFQVQLPKVTERPTIFKAFQKIRDRIARGEVDTVVIDDKELSPYNLDTVDFSLEAFSRWDD